jgi:cytochrome P450
VQSMFVPKSMDAMPSVMQPLIDELIDAILAGGNTADLVSQFTENFPVQVVAHLIGVSREHYPMFQKWAIALIGFTRDYDGGMAASKALADFLRPVIHERRQRPGDDVISRLVTGKVDGEGLTDDQVINFLRLLMPAGAETTFRLIGNLLVALLTDRENRWERVRADRSLVPWAIEETLRWETSVLMVSREATRDTEMRGVKIPAGGMVSVVVASANRDENHYENPDVYDLDRRADDHLAFGFGRHHCLGYHLANMEARIALESLMNRFPNLRLDPAAEPPRIRGLAFRSPDRLPVLLD